MALRSMAVLAAAAVAIPALATPAAADPVVDGEFAVEVGTNNQIGPGPDGNMWVTLDAGATNDVARLGPGTAVTEYDLTGLNDPVGITSANDRLWVTYNGGVASFDPASPATTTTTFAIAGITDPRAMTVGPDNNLWTGSDTKLFKIPPANPLGKTEYPVLAQARWITSGSDGNLWVADGIGGARVVRVTTGGAATPFATGGGPQGIAAGPNGQVGYTNPIANPQGVGRITDPGPALATDTPLADPTGITFGADGAYWFAQFAPDTLGRLTTDGQYSTLPLIAGDTGPRQISAGPNNTLWVTLDNAEKVVRVTGVNPPTPAPTPTPTPTPDPTLTTTITKAPKKVIRTSKPRAKVRVRFTGTAGATFECKVVKKPKKQAKVKWRACTSPKVYRLKKGKYTFYVRSKVGTGVDPTPAKAKFRVTRR